MGRWLRQIGGAALLLAAAGGLVYWEMDGRDRLLTEDVLVAARDIGGGTVVTREMFIESGIMEENKIDNGLTPKELDMIEGTRSRQFIPENSQVTAEFFQSDDFFIGADESVYVIKPEWISMMSSSVRQGDRVKLMTEDGSEIVGSYLTAFVKDNTYREVKNAYSDDGDAAAEDGGREGPTDEAEDFRKDGVDAVRQPDILKRTDASSVADHIEIIANIDEYRKILEVTCGDNPSKLLVIQE